MTSPFSQPLPQVGSDTRVPPVPPAAPVSASSPARAPRPGPLQAAQAWQVLQRACRGFMEDRAASMGAALAYYTLFAIAPLLVIVIALAGLAFGEDAARGQIVGQIASLVGTSTAQTIESMLAKAREPAQGMVATTVGALLALLGATSVFAELQGALDRIWQAPARDHTAAGWWTFLRARLLSFGLILGIGFLLIVSLVSSAAMAAFSAWWSHYVGAWAAVARVLDFVMNFTMLGLWFALIYKLMPSVRIAWSDVIVGAVTTAFLFGIGRWLIGMYLGQGSVTSVFGAAGSLVALMVWVYYSAQIFLLGAEFTWAYAHVMGSLQASEPGLPLARP